MMDELFAADDARNLMLYRMALASHVRAFAAGNLYTARSYLSDAQTHLDALIEHRKNGRK